MTNTELTKLGGKYKNIIVRNHFNLGRGITGYNYNVLSEEYIDYENFTSVRVRVQKQDMAIWENGKIKA